MKPKVIAIGGKGGTEIMLKKQEHRGPDALSFWEDETFGLGFTQNVRNALMDLDNNNSEILKMFSTDSFVATKNSNYDVIESIAVSVGIIEQ